MSSAVASRSAPLVRRAVRLAAALSSASPAQTVYPFGGTTAAAQRTMATGAKGSRGHGWYKKYRENRGGRHLQGRWHDRDVDRLSAINDKVFALNDAVAAQNKEAQLPPTKAYLDVSVGGAESSRIVIELASAALPQTCENFTKLCMEGGVVDATDRSAENWGYKGTNVYKIEKMVGLCMGDVLGQNGDGGRCHPSLWTPQSNHPHSRAYTIADEAHVISHTGPGIVTMLNSGVHENDSRFMITTANAPQLDGRFVGIGRVIDGMDLIEDVTENVFTKRGRPTVDIQVVGSGVL